MMFSSISGFNEMMRKGKRYKDTALIALMLYFLVGLIPTVFGQSLIFGPEIVVHNQSESQRLVRSFSVDDAGQKFILSVQGGGSGGKAIGRGMIEINGEIVASLALGAQFKMVAKPVSLNRKNDISITMSDGSDISMAVAIMSQEQHHIIVQVSSIGALADLPGFASIVFPAGAFDRTQQVMIKQGRGCLCD